MYICIVDDSNYNRFRVIFSCHYEGIIPLRANPLSLYPPIPYLQVSDHSVSVWMTKAMLFIGTLLVVTCWINLIHSWRSWIFHGWIHCGPHIFPLFNRWSSQSNKYCAGGMTCAAWFSLPINDSSVTVLIFLKLMRPWCCWPRIYASLLEEIISRIGC